jgi:hypothetical protein
MSIFNEKELIISHIKKHESEIGFNESIFEILEGDLLSHVAASLKEQLSENSYSSAMERVAPINIFRKINDKLSTLYVDDPKRNTELDSDQELIDDYTKEASINTFMEDLNKGYNAYKWSVIELYEDEGVKSRVLPSHQFLPYGNDKKNPLKVTAIIKFMGDQTKDPSTSGLKRKKTVRKYWVYSNEEFMAIDSDGDLVEEDMVENDGINPFGVLPFVFASKSRYLLVPKPDKDDLKLSILFPVLLTDLNFAAKFLAHSIFYGIDIDSDNLKLSPDAVWIFKSDEDGKKPEVGTIKPEVSIDEVLTLAKEQIGAWLDTKNVKVGSIGKMDGSAASSGISKIIDESDTSRERKKQEKFFKAIELQYWRVLATMHNRLVEAKRIRNMKTFSEPKNLIVTVKYSEQKPIQSRLDKITELKTERDAGFKSTKTAIKELNPDMDEEYIETEMILIDEENSITITEEADEPLDI